MSELDASDEYFAQFTPTNPGKAEHKADHQELARGHNIWDGSTPEDFASAVHAHTAAAVTVTDEGNNFTGTTVEAILAEIAATLNTLAAAVDSGVTDWTALGNLGASETVDAAAETLNRFYGTLDTNTAITVTVAANETLILHLIQDGTGTHNPSWAGVDLWDTQTGSAPSLAARVAGARDEFSFDNINGTVIGHWLTETVS